MGKGRKGLHSALSLSFAFPDCRWRRRRRWRALRPPPSLPKSAHLVLVVLRDSTVTSFQQTPLYHKTKRVFFKKNWIHLCFSIFWTVNTNGYNCILLSPNRRFVLDEVVHIFLRMAMLETSILVPSVLW